MTEPERKRLALSLQQPPEDAPQEGIWGTTLNLQTKKGKNWKPRDEWFESIWKDINRGAP